MGEREGRDEEELDGEWTAQVNPSSAYGSGAADRGLGSVPQGTLLQVCSGFELRGSVLAPVSPPPGAAWELGQAQKNLWALPEQGGVASLEQGLE